MNRSWDAVAQQPTPSWYMDPLVALQKRSVHQRLISEWTKGFCPQTVLKTDLFEEAFGQDHVLFDIVPGADNIIGMDVAYPTVLMARKRSGQPKYSFVTTDARQLAFGSETFDLVFSNSTLDHFDTEAELHASVNELVRIVRPGGRLILTLDNPWNPLYYPLRWITRRGGAPYILGSTTSAACLRKWLRESGMEVIAQDWLIHNPRLVSTGMFLVLRRLFGGRADTPIRGMLAFFEFLGKLPCKRLTACFHGICARKPLCSGG